MTPYLSVFLTLIALDAVWLTLRKQYHSNLFYAVQQSPLTVNWVAGGLVYFILTIMLVMLAVLGAKTIKQAALRGLLIGGAMYGFYDATNMATLSKWTWEMVITDTMWGAVASTAAAAVGFWTLGR